MALQLTHLAHEPAEAETAPPLLIAHGLYGSARNFNSLGKKLARNRRVVMVDMRNHGESPWESDMSYPAMAGDLAEAVDRLCGGRAVVLGHSMGGKAAMALALSHPERLAGLIVADIAPIYYDHSHAGYVDAMRAVDLARVSRRSDADPMLAERIPEPMLRSFLLQNLVVEAGVARWRLNLAALARALPDLMAWPGDWPETGYEGPPSSCMAAPRITCLRRRSRGSGRFSPKPGSKLSKGRGIGSMPSSRRRFSPPAPGSSRRWRPEISPLSKAGNRR